MEAITREEKLMRSAATGEPSGINPVTREEMFLAYAAGESDKKPIPITRKEKLLDKIEPGGGELPTQEKTVTITENGTTEVTPDEGFALGKVTANVDVAGGGSDSTAALAALISRSAMDFPYAAVKKADTIGERVFDKVVFNDTDIVIPDNVGVIDQYAFSQSNITSVIIPDNCEIRDYAFYYCENLERVEIPDSVTSLGWFLFDGCPKATVYCSVKSYAAQFFVEQMVPVAYTDNFVSLSVNTMPNVTTYPIGSRVDTTGLSLTAVLDDGSETTITAGYTIEKHAFSTGGTKTITVRLGEASAQFEVFVDETLPAYPESEHPYANNTDTTWSYTYPEDAGMLTVKFSKDCCLADGDYVEVSDANGSQPPITGNGLAGSSVMCMGGTFSIRLVSDGEGTAYGFSIDKIEKIW